MVSIGFIYAIPISLSQIASFIIGYWPEIYINLYWYLLIGGIIFVVSIDGKNPYCHWFCPFGAYQEFIGVIGSARSYRPRRFHIPMKWIQRCMAMLAIFVGLIYRQPTFATYEPFATLFNFEGNIATWILLVIITLGSLIIKRPWCNYLCPITPVVDFIGEGRRFFKEVVKNVRK